MSGYDPYEANTPDRIDPLDQHDAEIDEASSFLEDDFSEPVASATNQTAQEFGQPPDPPMPRAYVPSPATHAPIAATEVRCNGCGYNLTGITIGGSCPECGMSVGESIMMGSNPITSGLAVASMVIGIIAVMTGCFPFLGGILPLGGLTLSIISLNQLKSGAYSSASRGMAIAGVITNAVGLAIQGMILLLIY